MYIPNLYHRTIILMYTKPRTKTNKLQVTVAQLGQRRTELAWHPDVTLFPMVGQAVAAYQMEEIAAQVKN